MTSSVQQHLMVGILVISCVSFLRAAETIKKGSLGRYRPVNTAMDADGERQRTRKGPAMKLDSTSAPVRLVAPRPKRSGLPSASQIVIDDLRRNNLAQQAPTSPSVSSLASSFVVHLPLSLSPATVPAAQPGTYGFVPTWGDFIYPS